MVSLRCGYSLVQNIVLDVIRKAVTSSCRATARQAEVFDTFGLDAEIENVIRRSEIKGVSGECLSFDVFVFA